MSSADQSSGPEQIIGTGPGLEQPVVIVTGEDGKPHINHAFIEFAETKPHEERERLLKEAHRELEEALEKFRRRDVVHDDNN